MKEWGHGITDQEQARIVKETEESGDEKFRHLEEEKE